MWAPSSVPKTARRCSWPDGRHALWGGEGGTGLVRRRFPRAIRAPGSRGANAPAARVAGLWSARSSLRTVFHAEMRGTAPGAQDFVINQLTCTCVHVHAHTCAEWWPGAMQPAAWPGPDKKSLRSVAGRRGGPPHVHACTCMYDCAGDLGRHQVHGPGHSRRRARHAAMEAAFCTWLQGPGRLALTTHSPPSHAPLGERRSAVQRDPGTSPHG